MKTRIEELIGYCDERITTYSKRDTNYDNGGAVGISEIAIALNNIDQSHITPIEALKISPAWVKAIAMDRDGTWHIFEGHKIWFDDDCGEWELSMESGRYEKISLKIHYIGKPENSLITREDIA